MGYRHSVLGRKQCSCLLEVVQHQVHVRIKALLLTVGSQTSHLTFRNLSFLNCEERCGCVTEMAEVKGRDEISGCLAQGFTVTATYLLSRMKDQIGKETRKSCTFINFSSDFKFCCSTQIISTRLSLVEAQLILAFGKGTQISFFFFFLNFFFWFFLYNF